MATTVRNTTALTSLQATDAIYVERSGAAVGNHVEMTNFGLDISARVTHSVAQSIATATDAALAFDTERWDTNSIHDTVTNNTRLTCQAAGRYLIIGHVSFDSNATGTRAASIRLNGTTVLANQRRAAHTGSNNLEVSTDYRLVVGDYVEVVVYQDSGVALDVLKASAYSPEFSMSRLAP